MKLVLMRVILDFTPIEPETEEVSYETVEVEMQEIELDFKIDDFN